MSLLPSCLFFVSKKTITMLMNVREQLTLGILIHHKLSRIPIRYASDFWTNQRNIVCAVKLNMAVVKRPI